MPWRLMTALATALAVLAFAGSAQARLIYVANAGDGTVSAVDAATGSTVATIGVGKEPVDVAIAPDGSRVYVADKGSDSVSVIATATQSVIANIAVGKEPAGIAVAPSGASAYVASFGDESVSPISIASSSTGGPIHVGKEPEGVAISPDGSAVFVAMRSGGVAAISTSSNQVVGTIADSLQPSRLALTPNGGRAFVTNAEGGSVTAFDPRSDSTIGAPIQIGTPLAGIAVDPNGRNAYVTSPSGASVASIDASLASVASAPLLGFPGATGIAIAPDGMHGFVTDGHGSSATVLDVAGAAAVGSFGTGSKPTGIAVVPDQGPKASLFVSPAQPRAKKVVTLRASGSSDADGKVANYVWDFGDGTHAEGPEPTRAHRYRARGEYTIALRVVDDEGCSSEVVYTGQTASCNGSAAAIATRTIFVADTRGPALRLAGAKRQPVGGGVKVRARCPREPCGVQAHAALVVAGAGAPHSRFALAPAQASRPSTGWRVLHLRLSGSARAAASRTLAAGGEAKVLVSVLARDTDNELSLRKRKIRLRP